MDVYVSIPDVCSDVYVLLEAGYVSCNDIEAASVDQRFGSRSEEERGGRG